MWRGALAGLGIGLLAGWLLWGGPASGPDAGAAPLESTPAAPDDSGPTLSGGVRGSQEHVVAGTAQATANTRDPAGRIGEQDTRAAPPPDRSAVFLSEPIVRVRKAFEAHTTLTDREASALITRLGEARREKRSYDFLMLLRLLGRSGHPLAHKKFVELLADVEADLPEDFIELATEFLDEIRTPGMVEAALLRAHHEKKPTPWITLVTERGTREQWEELIASESRRFPPSYVFTLLMRKELDTARAYLKRAQSEPWPGGNRFNVLSAFIQHHPTEGHALLAEGFRAFADGAEEWYGANGVHMLLTLVFQAAMRDPAVLPLFAAELNGLTSRQDRLSACWGLRDIRGNDLRPVQPLIAQLGRDLREVVENPAVVDRPGERIRFIGEAMGEVSALQTPDNIAALEYAATNWDGSETKQLRDILKRVKEPQGEKWR